MIMKKKIYLLLFVLTSFTLSCAVFTINNAYLLSFGAFKSTSIYGLVLDSSNAPITMTGSIVETNAGNPIEIDYVDATLAAGKHIKLAKNGQMIIKSKLSGVDKINAVFSGKLHVESGLKNTNLCISELESNKECSLGGGYSFNYIKLVADEETVIDSVIFNYSCSEPGEQEVFGADVQSIGASVYGVKTIEKLGNTGHLHIDPFMGNTIEEVLLNGKSDLITYNNSTKTWEYECGTEDTIEVITSLTLHQTITVQNYIVDPVTGIASPDGEPKEVNPILSDDGYSYTVYPEDKEGYVVDKEYFKSVRDSEHDSVNFYYSKESKYEIGTVASASLSGAGTKTNPYLITNVADWLCFKTTYGASTKANKDKYFKMTRSIDLSGAAVADFMFGKSGVEFAGKFDGSNVRVTYGINNTVVRQSLIYNINGEFANLSLYGKNHSSTGTASLSSYMNPSAVINNISSYMDIEHQGGNAAGGLVGDVWGGKLMNSSFYGTVTDFDGNKNKTAGLVGVIEKDGGLLEECFNFGTVKGNLYVAGIAPFVNNEITFSLKNVYNFGSVIQTGAGNTSGIISQVNLNYVALDGCYNFGSITNLDNESDLKAGISDYLIASNTESKNIVKNCINFADIASKNNKNMGGCFCYVRRSAGVTAKVELIGCKNYGDVTTKINSGDTPVAGVLGSTYVLSGAATDEQKASLIASHVDFIDCENYGYIDGTQRSGGVAGWTFTSDMTNCVNCGNLGTRNGAVSKEWNGGIVGTSYNNASKSSVLSVYDCRNFGNIKVSTTAAGGITGSPSGNSTFIIDGCINFGDVTSGTTYAGGIVGQISVSIVAATVKSCSNYGTITGTDYVAGITGNVKSAEWTCDNNFYNYGEIVCGGTHFGELFAK